MTYTARHRGMFRAAASYSGVVHPLADPYGLLGGFGAFGAEDPYAIWGDPLAQLEIWTDHDPVYLAPSLRGTDLFLAVGNGEAGPFDPPGTEDGLEAFLQGHNIALLARLRQLRIPVTTDFYGPGTHSWPYWERELHRSLPILLGALGRATSSANVKRRSLGSVDERCIARTGRGVSADRSDGTRCLGRSRPGRRPARALPVQPRNGTR